MFSIFKPSPDQIDEFVRKQRVLKVSYTEIGATRNPALPSGYNANRLRKQLGSGEQTYHRATAALKEWRMYATSWTELHPPLTPVKPDEVIVVQAYHLGFWSLNPCKIIYVFDETGGDARRFGFAVGTLPGHSETGEEQFKIEIDAEGKVWYSLFAFAKAHDPLAKIGFPLVTLLQKQFARDSFQAMRNAVKV